MTLALRDFHVEPGGEEFCTRARHDSERVFLQAARADDFRPRSGHRVAVLMPCFNEALAIPKAVADFKKGKIKAADAIKGAVMRETKGMAKTELVQQILEAFLRTDADVLIKIDPDTKIQRRFSLMPRRMDSSIYGTVQSAGPGSKRPASIQGGCIIVPRQAAVALELRHAGGIAEVDSKQ